ncbi:hypothetical protein V565_120830 [Rhizoctonia solani 123E]|uniref:Uncharacterized protein n=1 Tax=Rhizoctonia solani 123E TaxID=1423351 RepID=A0A074RTC4_9AGAM|nr:hypothetical protein V565_120830 [Rhizoctonia solani 123E]
MKFSSPANIALASIALSSPNLLSSPIFAHAAPTGDPGSLSPNLGAGYFGTSPQMHAADSPVMPSPSTSKIAGRRRSLRRSRSIKHFKGEKSSRNIDPLGLGVGAGNIQSDAEPILRSHMAPAGLLPGTPGTIDPFSPIVGPGGLLANTGLVPPNTPMLGGVPLSNGVDPFTLLGAIPAVVPTPVVDNVIPIIQNTVTGPASVLSPLTGSLPLGGLLPNLGAAPIALPQVPSLTPAVGSLPLAGSLPSVLGAAAPATGSIPQLSSVLSHVPVSQVLPVAIPNVDGLAPPAVLSNLGAFPNVAVPSIAGAPPGLPGLLGDPPVSDPIPHALDAIPQVPSILPQAPGGTGMVPGGVSQLPAGPLSKINPDLATPNLAGVPVPVGSGTPLASPAVPVTGSVVPTGNLDVPVTSMVPLSSVTLPTPVSGLDAPPTLLPNSDALPISKTDHLTQPIQSLPPNPLGASNSVPHIIVSSPDAVGVFEPLEGVGAGAMGHLDDVQTKSNRPENGGVVPPMESGPGMPGTHITSDIKSAVEPTWSERPMADRASELVPTTVARPSAKLDVPMTTAPFASKPTPTDAQLASSPDPTLHVKEEILPVGKRWESKSPSLPSDVGSSVIDKSGSLSLSDEIPVPTSSVYVPSAARLTGPSQDDISVSRSASMVTLKSFSMASITESTAPIPAPAQTAPAVIGGLGSSLGIMDMAQPTGLVPTFSDDSIFGHSLSDEHLSHVSPTAIAVASFPITTPYTGGAPLSRSLERSADSPSSVVGISGDSPDVPSPALLGTGTSTGSQDTATRKIFRWGVPKMVKSRIRSVAVAVKK